MDKNVSNDIPEGMIIPELETVKGNIRKTMIDENGLTYEIEEEIDIPIFPKDDNKNTENKEIETNID